MNNQTVTEVICENAEQQAKKLADAVIEQLQKAIDDKDQAVLAVSGGRSPIVFFTELSNRSFAWDKVTITLVDERVVETKHADSNTELVRQYLLVNQAKSASFHGLIPDSADELTLQHIGELSQVANEHFIQPDAVVLGMGEDGHTASLFPHVADLDATDAIIAVTPETAPYVRISLSLQTILDASSIFLAIGGDKKMAVYKQSKLTQTDDYPISYVLHQASRLVEVYCYG